MGGAFRFFRCCKSTMPELYLLRHAKSAWDEPGLADRDRPLGPRGRRDAPRVARELARLGLRPEVVWLSPSLRTRQTAEVVLPALGDGFEIRSEDWMYLPTGEALAAALGRCPASLERLMIVGHMPSLGELAQLLDPTLPDHLPTGACLGLRLERWGARTAEVGRVELLFFVLPRLLG